MKKNKNILVVAAHPDDEVLGCGGTLANLSKKGFNIYTLFVSDGVSARNETKGIMRRKIEQRKFLNFYFIQIKDLIKYLC